jgi:hypothetical protein
MVGVDGGPPKTRGLLVKQSKVWPNGFKLKKRREHGKISKIMEAASNRNKNY